jgi:hypothetical protein
MLTWDYKKNPRSLAGKEMTIGIWTKALTATVMRGKFYKQQERNKNKYTYLDTVY